MDRAQTYIERVPRPALAARVRTVWVQRTGPRPYVQRNLPTGGVELQCPIGALPRLVGPLTVASVQVLPSHATLVGARFWPGAASASPTGAGAGTTIRPPICRSSLAVRGPRGRIDDARFVQAIGPASPLTSVR